MFLFVVSIPDDGDGGHVVGAHGMLNRVISRVEYPSFGGVEAVHSILHLWLTIVEGKFFILPR